MASDVTVRGACPHDCPDRCGWVVTVRDGTATALAGAKDHPDTRGVLCAKVDHFLDRVYADGRLLRPLRRTGPKGSASFEPVSWDRALDDIATRLREIIDRHGPTANPSVQLRGHPGAAPGERHGAPLLQPSRRLAARPHHLRVDGQRRPGGDDWSHARDARRGSGVQPLHHPLGHQHGRHQPAPVARDPRRAKERRQGGRRRSAPHAHRRSGRLARAPDARVGRGARARDDARDRRRGSTRCGLRREAHGGHRGPPRAPGRVHPRARRRVDRGRRRHHRLARSLLRDDASRRHPGAGRHRSTTPPAR